MREGDLGTFNLDQTEEERSGPHRLSIPALQESLRGSRSPQSSPLFGRLPPDVQALLRSYLQGYNPRTVTAGGSEVNRGPLQAILAGIQGQGQQVQGNVQQVLSGIGGAGNPGLLNALQDQSSQPSAPSQAASDGVSSPQPTAGPDQPPEDPYAAWGGYNNYLLWLYGMDPSNQRDTGSDVGGDVGGGGADSGGGGGGGADSGGGGD